MPTSATPHSLLLSDYSGHAFTYGLADELHRRGREVAYSYCATTVTPKASFSGSVRCWPVRSGRRFEKYRLVRRAISEVRYGLGTARVVRRERPAVHVVCNMPLLTALIVWVAGLPGRSRFVVWFQDVQSGLAESSLRAGPMAWVIRRLEGLVLRRADRVIAISEPLAFAAERFGVPPDRIGRLRNWAPIEELPAGDRRNRWSTEHDLDGCFVYLYAGTLARKHRSDLLLELARAIHGDERAVVVVVSEGEGADELRRLRRTDDRLERLIVLDFQPFDRMSEVLATADVLIVLLEPTASAHSVPSKTLSYLCAGRPVLAAMPRDNDAATILVDEAGAGVVVEPSDAEGFVAEASRLREATDQRERLGRAGRSYAERNFATDRIVESFSGQIALAAKSWTPC